MTESTRIGLLRMCASSEAMISVHGSYRGVFEAMFAGRPVSFIDFAVYEGDAPASLADADVWVVSGSPASVYDDLPWIPAAEAIVRDAADTETPFIGVCFGHQLVAQALGGRVEQSDRGWGIGALDYTTVSRVATIADLPDTLTMLALHQDQVVEVPDRAEVWSSSTFCPNAGLAVGERMWTVQGHPEFTPELVQALYPSRRDLVGDDAVAAALGTLHRPLSTGAVADAILATAKSSPSAAV